ncbi:hypothetical protein GCM10008018_68890 [Paenibacillus marchantiophytorum]|uniref:Uncharacterized protein n=1 Tax=Paenibacillus marchantiophytorum TaxID=1619310 RepID=A0ABQ1FHL8_9BACL|nr:hypothetical protein GCM10008018_68890 [Paenibacillus marchantiophytorum]
MYWKQYVETLAIFTLEELYSYINNSYVSKVVIYRLLGDYEIPYKRNFLKTRTISAFCAEDYRAQNIY